MRKRGRLFYWYRVFSFSGCARTQNLHFCEYIDVNAVQLFVGDNRFQMCFENKTIDFWSQNCTNQYLIGVLYHFAIKPTPKYVKISQTLWGLC